MEAVKLQENQIADFALQFQKMCLDLNNGDNVQNLSQQMLYSNVFMRILDYLTVPQLLKIQLLNRYAYETLIPIFFETCIERKNCLKSFKVKGKSCVTGANQAILLFQGEKSIYTNTFFRAPHLADHNTNLRWTKSKVQLYTQKYGYKQDFEFQEDWAKIIHLTDNDFFVCGGSWQNDSVQAIPQHMRLHKYSKKAFIINSQTGLVRVLDQMKFKRQAHGMIQIGNFVYCCAGLDGGWDILNSCERFNLITEQWQRDVPDMNEKQFSMSMQAIDKRWIYSFGGANLNFHVTKGFIVERLDTFQLPVDYKEFVQKEGTLQQKLDALTKWERIEISCDFKSSCQQGVIRLNCQDADKRRFLVFGGVHGDYTDQTFIFIEDLKTFKNSKVEGVNKKQKLSFGDKFYFQQQMRLSDLPEGPIKKSALTKKVQPGRDQIGKGMQDLKYAHYSENISIFTGRRGLHVFDVDHERWLFNSKKEGYMYEDIYYNVRGLTASDEDQSEGSEDEVDEEVVQQYVQQMLQQEEEKNQQLQEMINETDQNIYGIEPEEEDYHSATDDPEDHETQINSTTNQGQIEVVKQIFSDIMEKIKLKIKPAQEEEEKQQITKFFGWYVDSNTPDVDLTHDEIMEVQKQVEQISDDSIASMTEPKMNIYMSNLDYSQDQLKLFIFTICKRYQGLKGSP